MALDIYIKMSKLPARCTKCGRELRIGQRIVTDGEYDFDSCDCERKFRWERIKRWLDW
jgi:hypothetical protein